MMFFIFSTRVVCEEFYTEFGEPHTNFPCYYSQLDPELVITQLNMKELYLTLLYSITIPISLFIIAVLYLFMACWYIYPRPAPVSITT